VARKSLVKEYMTKNVISVHPDTPNVEVIKKMKDTGHDGYPVVDDDEQVAGIVTAFDLLLKDWVELVKDIMSKDVVVAQPNMSMNDASRIMFRHGISRLPVVDKEGKLLGIITNTDMVRSHIERSTPDKAKSLKKTFEHLYNAKTILKRMKVPMDKLRPTQDKIYADELEGRTYELKRGLAEPAIVAKSGDRWILIDGHHRAVASFKLGYDEIDSYVIEFKKEVRLGLEKTADETGIKTFEDVHIIDDDQHPLIAVTESVRQNLTKKEQEGNRNH